MRIRSDLNASENARLSHPRERGGSPPAGETLRGSSSLAAAANETAAMSRIEDAKAAEEALLFVKRNLTPQNVGCILREAPDGRARIIGLAGD